MKAQLFKGAVLYQIHDDQEAQPSKYNQSGRSQVQQHIVLISRQVFKSPQYIKPRIVKRGHRVEQADSNRL